MKNSAGIPIGVQVSSLPFHDEIALHAMQEIEFALDQTILMSKLAKRYEMGDPKVRVRDGVRRRRRCC